MHNTAACPTYVPCGCSVNLVFTIGIKRKKKTRTHKNQINAVEDSRSLPKGQPWLADYSQVKNFLRKFLKAIKIQEVFLLPRVSKGNLPFGRSFGKGGGLEEENPFYRKKWVFLLQKTRGFKRGIVPFCPIGEKHESNGQK